MREAVGSTFLFQIMIVFIFFFTAFLAIAINYSQAFQIKNQVINSIEQAEGYNETSRENIRKLANNSNYYRNVNCPDDYIHVTSEGVELNGICVKQNRGSTTGSAYYSVQTYVHFDLPIIGNFIAIPVKGETKLIVNDNYEP